MINNMEDKYLASLKYLNRPSPLPAFQHYFLESSSSFPEVIAKIRVCSLQQTGSRFNIWRLCLGIIRVDSDWNQKKSELQRQRKRYAEIKQEIRTGVKQINNTGANSNNTSAPVAPPTVIRNPLMKGPIKLQQKKQPESDSFLLEEIKKDVDRTYQELPFFQESAILKLLTSILYAWCKLNPEVSYKQGMNELLASVVFVYFQECADGEKGHGQGEGDWQKYIFSNGLAFCEPDIYSVFQRLMQIQKEMYKTQADSQKKDQVNPNSKNNTPILQRIMQIQDHRLKALDLELFRILKLQDVKTKSFLLRWIRCMHTRQFSLQSSFYIWDCIFLDYYESPLSKKKTQFQFIDSMCLAMFIYMRSIVLTRQTSNQILQIYSKYPVLKKGEYLEDLVKLAWAVCDELRNQSQGQQMNNWYVEGDKHGTLGLMEKGGYAATVRNREIQEKKKKIESEQKKKLEKLRSIRKRLMQYFIKIRKKNSKNNQILYNLLKYLEKNKKIPENNPKMKALQLQTSNNYTINPLPPQIPTFSQVSHPMNQNQRYLSQNKAFP